MHRLIVTADDFGASPDVNAAVETAHREGILTAASLMVAATGAAEALEIARRNPALGVGLHLVLVEGRPALPPERVPDLVDTTGHFRTGMVGAGITIFAKPAARRQLAAEIEAQFAAFARTGLQLDHVNAHKHFHLHPTIASLIVRIGAAHGVKGARVPLEPQGVLARIEKHQPSGVVALTAPFARLLRRRFQRAGIAAPDQVFGLAWSGAMTPDRLAGLIAHLPDGLSEIYTHPAIGNYPGCAPGYLYARELAALTDAGLPALVAANNIRVGGFADFPVQ